MKRSIHKESSSVSNEFHGSSSTLYYDVTRMLQIFSAFASLPDHSSSNNMFATQFRPSSCTVCRSTARSHVGHRWCLRFLTVEHFHCVSTMSAQRALSSSSSSSELPRGSHESLRERDSREMLGTYRETHAPSCP